ncbi:hypothetical protein QYF36_023363 [Acer negundo]|nr:hypothetical protein QYF36_023363 [Acer negundo]
MKVTKYESYAIGVIGIGDNQLSLIYQMPINQIIEVVVVVMGAVSFGHNVGLVISVTSKMMIYLIPKDRKKEPMDPQPTKKQRQAKKIWLKKASPLVTRIPYRELFSVAATRTKK